MRIIIVIYSYLVRHEVFFDFPLGEEVNTIEDDGVATDEQIGAFLRGGLSSLYVVSILFKREAMEELQESASQDIFFLLLAACHALLDLPAEGLPLGVGGFFNLLMRYRSEIVRACRSVHAADISQL